MAKARMYEVMEVLKVEDVVKLNRMYNKAYEVLNGVLKEEVPKYDMRIIKAKSYHGLCRYRDKLIAVNEHIIAHEDSCTNTIIHELLHAYVYENYKCVGHKGKWKTLAQKISKNSVYEITRVATEKLIPEDEPKYIVTCTKCRTEYKRTKRSKFVNNYEDYGCGKCNSYNTFVLKIN